MMDRDEVIGGIVWLIVLGGCAVLLFVFGCSNNKRIYVKTPYPYDMEQVSKWLVQNVEKVQGPSLTGYAIARHQIEPRIDLGNMSVSVEHVGTKRVKFGLVQIHDPDDWEDFREYQGQMAAIGLGFEWRF